MKRSIIKREESLKFWTRKLILKYFKHFRCDVILIVICLFIEYFVLLTIIFVSIYIWKWQFVYALVILIFFMFWNLIMMNKRFFFFSIYRCRFLNFKHSFHWKFKIKLKWTRCEHRFLIKSCVIKVKNILESCKIN